MIEKDYYEGSHDLEELNNQSNHQIKLEYIPDLEEEMLDLISEWGKSL